MSLKDIQKQNQKQNECKTSKRERRKKFSRFKDTLHRNFGSPIFHGIGEGKQPICDVCGVRAFVLTSKWIKGNIINFCEVCRSKRCYDCDKEGNIKKIIRDGFTYYFCLECLKKREESASKETNQNN